MFEVRDRPGKLRAIAGGGRYDRLLETFGGENQPCAGFGFGDAVIVELFKELDLMPELKHHVRRLCGKHVLVHLYGFQLDSRLERPVGLIHSGVQGGMQGLNPICLL